MKSVAVIPARGGSKRIPRKNLRHFCGKPIIAYSIDAALTSGIFDKVIVSTDDLEIAAIAQKLGAEVPFMRPANLSDDFATTAAVMKHAVSELALAESDLCCCIYATAPFLTVADLQDAANRMQNDENLAYSFSATAFDFPIQRGFSLVEGKVKMLQPEHLFTRSQDLPKAYHDAGQFYLGRVSSWLLQKPIFAAHSSPVILPSYRVQDIDCEDDWKRAEFLYRAQYE